MASLVTAPGAARAISNPDRLSSPEVIANGDQILNVLIGNKHVSRKIAARTASKTSIDAATVQKMLSVVATLLIGELQRQSAPAIAKAASRIPVEQRRRRHDDKAVPGPLDSFARAPRSVRSHWPPLIANGAAAFANRKKAGSKARPSSNHKKDRRLQRQGLALISQLQEPPIPACEHFALLLDARPQCAQSEPYSKSVKSAQDLMPAARAAFFEGNPALDP